MRLVVVWWERADTFMQIQEWTAHSTATQKSHCLTYFNVMAMREKLARRCADAYETFMLHSLKPVLDAKIGRFPAKFSKPVFRLFSSFRHFIARFD
jgi:hypothetical protein